VSEQRNGNKAVTRSICLVTKLYKLVLT